MNKFKLSAFGFGLMLLIASCKKEDVQQANASKTQAPASMATTATSEWRSLNNWTSSKGEKVTAYFSKVSDSAVTTDVARSGLVLAFFKNSEGVQSLPFLQKNNSYWYYQVAKGSISFSVEDYSGTIKLNANQFTYFVFTPQKLQELGSAGYSKSKLMQMSYADIAGLLKK